MDKLYGRTRRQTYSRRGVHDSKLKVDNQNYASAEGDEFVFSFCRRRKGTDSGGPGRQGFTDAAERGNVEAGCRDRSLGPLLQPVLYLGVL
jgi:hypothetical protein